MTKVNKEWINSVNFNSKGDCLILAMDRKIEFVNIESTDVVKEILLDQNVV